MKTALHFTGYWILLSFFLTLFMMKLLKVGDDHIGATFIVAAILAFGVVAISI